VVGQRARLPRDDAFQRCGKAGVAGFGDLARVKQGAAYAAVDAVRPDDEPARPFFAVSSGHLASCEIDRGNGFT